MCIPMCVMHYKRSYMTGGFSDTGMIQKQPQKVILQCMHEGIVA